MNALKNELEDTICVVTGGTQGIGWAIVQALADHGGTVYACGYSEASLDRARQEAANLPWPDRLHLSRCDVTDHLAYTAWLETIQAANGRIDVLVNNAAFVRWANVLEMPLVEQEQTMRVGYDGMIYGIKAVLPGMLARNRGHIINIGSIAGRVFVGGSSAAYAAVKAAMDAYTQILQVELQDTAVAATIFRLGTVAGTDFLGKHVSNDRMPPVTKFIPPLTPPKVADAVVKAIRNHQQIVTMPRYLGALEWVYNISPRFARWLSYQGGANKKDYGAVTWEYETRQKK